MLETPTSLELESYLTAVEAGFLLLVCNWSANIATSTASCDVIAQQPAQAVVIQRLTLVVAAKLQQLQLKLSPEAIQLTDCQTNHALLSGQQAMCNSESTSYNIQGQTHNQHCYLKPDKSSCSSDVKPADRQHANASVPWAWELQAGRSGPLSARYTSEYHQHL